MSLYRKVRVTGGLGNAWNDERSKPRVRRQEGRYRVTNNTL